MPLPPFRIAPPGQGTTGQRFGTRLSPADMHSMPALMLSAYS